MKKIAIIISGIVLILGCITLGISLLLSAVLPNILEVYLIADSAGFSHEVLYPNMTGPSILAVAEILAGLIGVFYFGWKSKE